MGDDQIKPNVGNALLNSSAINSLKLETDVYKVLKGLNWNVAHSPYYVDTITGKLREMDVTARKLFYCTENKDISCDVLFIIECKSIKDYHVVASSCYEKDSYLGLGLNEIQLGDDFYNSYNRLKHLLDKYNMTSSDISEIINELENVCHPNGVNFFNNYRISAFKIPIFNSFRETNIATSKDIETSVVWKAFQSLSSCIEKYHELLWEDIEFNISNITFEKPRNRIAELKKIFSLRSQHVKFIHPVLVLESNLWELEDSSVKAKKYFRLVFNRIYKPEIWIDVVNREYMEEYFEKSKEYDEKLARYFRM